MPADLTAAEQQRFDNELARLRRPEILLGIRNGAWLDAQVFDPLEYHLPGIIPEGFSLLVGAPKVGKSWLVLSLALAAAEGGRCLGIEVPQRPVLYFALEDSNRRIQDRCRKLLHGAPIPDAFEYQLRVDPERVIDTAGAWLDLYPTSLVILDTLGKVLPPALNGESSYQRDYRIGGDLKRLTDSSPGAGVVVNHHDRKAGSDDFVERVSGTNGLAGSADTIVVVTRPRGETDGTVAVTGRDVDEGEYAVSFDPFTGNWTVKGATLEAAAKQAKAWKATAGLDEKARAVVEYINGHPEGVRYSDVAETFGDTEARYLSRLADKGRIVRADRGLYLPLSEVSEVSETDRPTGQSDTSDTPLPEVFE